MLYPVLDHKALRPIQSHQRTKFSKKAPDKSSIKMSIYGCLNLGIDGRYLQVFRVALMLKQKTPIIKTNRYREWSK